MEYLDFFDKWQKSIMKLPSLRLKKRLTVQGSYKKHLGPRLEYAVIEIIVEPSDCLLIDIKRDLILLNSLADELIEAAIFGILDILLTSKPYPLRDVKINVVEVDIHPVDSKVPGFRCAGRDAGRKIMKSLDN